MYFYHYPPAIALHTLSLIDLIFSQSKTKTITLSESSDEAGAQQTAQANTTRCNAWLAARLHTHIHTDTHTHIHTYTQQPLVWLQEMEGSLSALAALHRV